MKDNLIGLAGLFAFLFLVGWLQNRDLEAKQWKAGVECTAPSDHTKKLIVTKNQYTNRISCAYHPVKTYGMAP